MVSASFLTSVRLLSWIEDIVNVAIEVGGGGVMCIQQCLISFFIGNLA